MAPLTHLRVADFGHYVAGPLAGMMLADQGATVTKIDPPACRSWQNLAGDVLDRGKTCVGLDLKDKADYARACQIISESDVLIENFRPGVMERLGLGPQACFALNPDLIYLSMPGFASTDVGFRDIRAWEGVIASLMGQFRDMGLNRVLMGIDPSYSPLVLASAYGAVLGVAAATVAVAAGARGKLIEVPLASALMEGLTFNSMRIENLPRRYMGNREREIQNRKQTGRALDLSYTALQRLLDPFYRSYICRDGRPYYLVACGHALHPVRIMKLLGIWDEMVERGLPIGNAYDSSKTWPEGQDCVISAYSLSQEWSDILSERLAAVFMARPAGEWENFFGAERIPGAMHRTSEEWLGSAHAIQSGLLIDRPHPEHGTVRQPGPTVWFEGKAKSVAPQSVVLGAETPSSKWLSWLKVLDLSNVIAGPIIGQTLARFGADVVKIDPVMPQFDPWTTIGFGIAANRGKRSLLLDLKSEEGQKILDRLLADADLVLVNAVATQAERLGLNEARLAAAGSKAILCRIDAFGGPRPGPNSEFYGYDDTVQAATGIMSRFGGSITTPEEHAHVGTIDVLCGFAGVFACAAALIARQRGEIPGTARTSLSALGQLIQLPFMLDFPGKRHGNEPSGRAVKGEHPLYRAYSSADQWMFVAGSAEALPLILEQIGASDANDRELELVFEKAPLSHWRDVLRPLGIEVVPMRRLADIRAESVARRHDGKSQARPTVSFTHWSNHPAGPVELLDFCGTSVSDEAQPSLNMAPKYGKDSAAILREAGLSAAEIDDLIARGVVSVGWSQDYMID